VAEYTWVCPAQFLPLLVQPLFTSPHQHQDIAKCLPEYSVSMILPVDWGGGIPAKTVCTGGPAARETSKHNSRPLDGKSLHAIVMVERWVGVLLG
jgi:hypothetical protein